MKIERSKSSDLKTNKHSRRDSANWEILKMIETGDRNFREEENIQKSDERNDSREEWDRNGVKDQSLLCVCF
jgi:hypothetical protein